MPSSSGPRWRITSVIARTSPGFASFFRSRNPAIPHMLVKSYHSSRAALVRSSSAAGLPIWASYAELQNRKDGGLQLSMKRTGQSFQQQAFRPRDGTQSVQHPNCPDQAEFLDFEPCFAGQPPDCDGSIHPVVRRKYVFLVSRLQKFSSALH